MAVENEVKFNLTYDRNITLMTVFYVSQKINYMDLEENVEIRCVAVCFEFFQMFCPMIYLW